MPESCAFFHDVLMVSLERSVDGHYRDKKVMDSLIQGEAGLIALTGTEENPARSAWRKRGSMPRT